MFVLALAYDESHCREIIGSEMESLGLIVVELDSKGSFDPLTESWDDEEAQELNGNLSDEWPVQYRTFDCYPREDTNG